LEKFDAALREHERLYTTGFFQLERFWEAAWNIKFIAQHAGVDIPALKNLPRLENVRVSLLAFFRFYFIFLFYFILFYFILFYFILFYFILFYIILPFYLTVKRKK